MIDSQSFSFSITLFSVVFSILLGRGVLDRFMDCIDADELQTIAHFFGAVTFGSGVAGCVCDLPARNGCKNSFRPKSQSSQLSGTNLRVWTPRTFWIPASLDATSISRRDSIQSFVDPRENGSRFPIQRI